MKSRVVGLSAEDVSHAEMLRMRLISASQEDGVSPTRFFELLEALLKEKAWEKLGIEFTDLVMDPPPTGMGLDEENFRKLINLRHRYEDRDSSVRERMRKVRETVAKELTPTLKEPHRPKKEERINLYPDTSLGTGTSRDRILARLKNKHSDLFAQVVNGEITAAEGARRAGIAKRKRRAEVYPDDINHTARVLKKHFDPDELMAAIMRAREGRERP